MARKNASIPKPVPARAATVRVPDDLAARAAPAPRTQRTPLERLVIRSSKFVGSLQVAVLAMTALVVVLIAGTMFESYYSGKAAQELVYKTWWFNVLMGVLFLNIFFAAAKKWPWKRHQTGFVVTHIGLLMLISGGVVNSIGGTDMLMILASDENERVRREGVTQVSDEAFDPDHSLIEVRWPRQYGREARQYDFSPGSLSWKSDNIFKLKLDPAVHVASWLAHPLPRSWSADLGHGASLEVLNFYTHARLHSYRELDPAEKLEPRATAGPALRFELSNPRLGRDAAESRWLGSDSVQAGFASIQDIAIAELKAKVPLNAAQIKEFLSPPADGAAGNCGTVVLLWNGEPTRIPVAPALGQPAMPIGQSGWSVRVLDYRALAGDDEATDLAKELSKTPVNPQVALEFRGPDPAAQPIRTSVIGWSNGQFHGLRGRSLPAELSAWFHAPSERHGLAQLRAILQFACDADGAFHYRAFNSGAKPKPGEPEPPADEMATNTPAGPVTGGQFGFEKGGKLPEADERLIVWGAMRWELRVPKRIARAVETIEPVNRRPGLEHPEFYAAVRCRLTVGRESKEFTVGRRRAGTFFEPVEVAGERLQVAFSRKTVKLPFQVKLLRAEETTDPGSTSAATYSSFIQVLDPKNNYFEESHIWMNNPLDYQSYKLYQTGMDTKSIPPDPETLKPVVTSTFTVGYDPGITLKYAGSVFLAAGIFLMFYMGGYFKKRPSRTARATA